MEVRVESGSQKCARSFGSLQGFGLTEFVMSSERLNERIHTKQTVEGGR